VKIGGLFLFFLGGGGGERITPVKQV